MRETAAGKQVKASKSVRTLEAGCVEAVNMPDDLCFVGPDLRSDVGRTEICKRSTKSSNGVGGHRQNAYCNRAAGRCVL